MKSWKWKILVPVILISLLAVAKYVVFDFPVSTGKRVGNLTKISKKGKLYPTWEGTIDEGSGDQLTTLFSVRDNEVGEELYNYEGRQVILYYEQYMVGWPRDTTYNVTSWKPKGSDEVVMSASQDGAVTLLSKTLFCSLLGSLVMDQELYQRVKAHIKESNLYLYNQFNTCNE